MDSPLTRLLKANYPPTDTERSHISAIISEQKSRLARIDNEIDSLLSPLDPLLRARDATRSSLSAHINILSPARRVPPEIWSEVFTRCLPTKEHVPIDTTQAPLLLVRICSAWRSVALSTPRLWNSLYFEGRGGGLPKEHSQLITQWLSRSGTLPLSIKIDAMSPLGQDLIHTLLSFAPRMRDLDIIADATEQRQIVDASMPTLTTLAIRAHTVLRTLNVSSLAPNLRRLVIPGVDSITSVAYPWAKLTALDVTLGIEYNECFFIFRRCQSLSRLALHAIHGTYNGQARARVVLRHLTFLQLCPLSGVGTLLDNLTLPSLREANVAERNSSGRSNEVLFALLARSACPLDTLTISSVVPVRKLVEIVQWVQTLKTIHLTWPVQPLPPRVVAILATRDATTRRA